MYPAEHVLIGDNNRKDIRMLLMEKELVEHIPPSPKGFSSPYDCSLRWRKGDTPDFNIGPRIARESLTLWEGWVRRPNLKVDHLDNRWRPAEVFQGDIVGNERLFVIADRGSIHGNDANVFNYYIGDFQIKQRASRDVSGLLSYGNLPPTSLPQLIRRSDQPIGYVDEQSVEGGNKSSANLIGVGEDEGPEAFLLGFLVLGLVPFYLALLAAFLIDPLSPIERRSRDGDIKKRRKDDQADWD